MSQEKNAQDQVEQEALVAEWLKPPQVSLRGMQIY